jgi:hypothetical protein
MNSDHAPVQDVVLNAISNMASKAVLAPGSQGARNTSVGEGVVSTSIRPTTNQFILPAGVPDQVGSATWLSVQGDAANRFVAPVQSSGGRLVTGQTGESNANSTSVSVFAPASASQATLASAPVLAPDSVPVIVPVLHGAWNISRSEDVVSTSSRPKANQSNVPSLVLDPRESATWLSVQGGTANRFVAAVQLNGGMLVTGQTMDSNAHPNSTTNLAPASALVPAPASAPHAAAAPEPNLTSASVLVPASAPILASSMHGSWSTPPGEDVVSASHRPTASQSILPALVPDLRDSATLRCDQKVAPNWLVAPDQLSGGVLVTGQTGESNENPAFSLKLVPASATNFVLISAAILVPASVPVLELASSSNASGASALHGAWNRTTNEDVVSESDRPSTNQSIAPAPVPDQRGSAEGHSVQKDVANLFVAMAQLSGGPLETRRASESNANPASGSTPLTVDAINSEGGVKGQASEVAGLNQRVHSASNHSGSQTGSNEAPPYGDQSQGNNLPLGQEAAALQMNASNHAVSSFAHAQSMTIALPLQPTLAVAGIAGRATMAPDNALLAPAAVAQSLPGINTAKLIQTIGQSEMRVGMRSTEFGNISISTSATREMISAQISLDHRELAKILAAHLPEMQARLGTNQTVEMRIDVNGSQGGRSTGSSADMTNSSNGESHSGRQQASHPATRIPNAEVVGGQFSPVAAVIAEGDIRNNIRLDIRI